MMKEKLLLNLVIEGIRLIMGLYEISRTDRRKRK